MAAASEGVGPCPIAKKLKYKYKADEAFGQAQQTQNQNIKCHLLIDRPTTKQSNKIYF